MLKDKVAVVTGAGRGIGREIAKTFAGYGAKVVVNFNGSEERANSLVEEIKAAGGEAVTFKANVADFAEAEALMKFAVATYGRIDILVNNAGITRDNLVLGMKEADFDDVININLKGTFNMIKHTYKHFMKKRYGRICSTASIVGLTGNAGQANYSASKAGIIGLTKSVAKELAGRGVTANAVAPGYIATDMTSVLPDKVKDAMKAQIPAKRIGTPEDVANVVAFLCSDDAAYVTGEVIKVDGGLAM